MPRIILTLKEILPLTKSKMDLDTLKTKMTNDNEYRHGLAKKYAMKHTLYNGATLEFPADGYRNNNLLFWDAENKEIVEPFTDIDDYGSVPPRFVVGNGHFNPFHWVKEVDHNAYVFPAKSLIDEMKEFVTEHPNENKMIVHINGSDYTVDYDPKEMKDKWDTCIFEVSYGVIQVYPGDPNWYKASVEKPGELEEKLIVVKNSVVTKKPSELEELQKSVQELIMKVSDLSTKVEQLGAKYI